MQRGRRMNGCLTLVVQCEARSVTPVEGLAGAGGQLHPVQQAFADHDAFQCGYCTPGQLMSAVACIAEGHATDDASVREWMSGNICRCSAYPQITAAVLAAARDPVVDGPVVEGPVVEGPAVEGPAVEGPAVEGPAVEGPAVEGRADR